MLALYSELLELQAWDDFERVARFEMLLNRVLMVAENFPGKSFAVSGHDALNLRERQYSAESWSE